MQIQPVQAIQNSNSNSMIKPIEEQQNKLGMTDAKAVASPTPVVAGAPVQTQKADSVELSNKNDKKTDKTIILACGIGILIAGISALISKKPTKV